MLPSANAKRLLPVMVLVLTCLAFTPSRFTGWVTWLGGLAEFFVAPISQPFFALSRWLSPAERRPHDDEALRALEDQAEGYRQQLLREQQVNSQLREQIRELQRGIAINPDLAVTQLTAPVIGVSSDLTSGLLRVRAGARESVEVNTVATARGLQLLGKVVSVASRTSQVQPMTDKVAGRMQGVVMASEVAIGASCLLEPLGDGTLRGDVEYERSGEINTAPDGTVGGGAPFIATVGQTVRLSDPTWPRSAQMLVIGLVERVEPKPDQPLRQVITVRPTLRLDRVSEVVLRLSRDAAEPAQGREGSR